MTAEASLLDRLTAALGPAGTRDELRGRKLQEFVAVPLPEEWAHLSAWDALGHLWPLIARPSQLEPPGDWSTWAVTAGRAYGKTKLAAQWVVATAQHAAAQVARGALPVEHARILVLAPTSADLRDVVVEGPAGLAVSSPPWFPATYEPSKRRVGWPGGVEATLISADEVDRIRGHQGIAAWGDEIAVWPQLTEAVDNLRFAIRLGDRPRVLFTTTPRRRKALRDLLAGPRTHVTVGRTRDNAAWLAPGVVAELEERYGGSRIGRQELDGELLADAAGALWQLDTLDRARVQVAPDLKRVVIAIDPAGSSRPNSDETGIVTCGIGPCRCKGEEAIHGFVIGDASGRYSPERWAALVASLYERHGADRVVAERNFGGDMVEATLRAAAPAVSFRAVTASRGKAVRAEPVAALYEQGRIHHVGVLRDLENQMTEWDPLHDSHSPDRVDALVWALTDLMPTMTRPRGDWMPRGDRARLFNHSRRDYSPAPYTPNGSRRGRW